MKLLLDENISPITAEYLRQNFSHDVKRISFVDFGRRLEDDEVATIALSEDRFVLSFDVRFGVKFIACEFLAAGVLVFRLKDQRPERLNEMLSELFSKFPNEGNIRNKLLVIRERKIRIRNKR